MVRFWPCSVVSENISTGQPQMSPCRQVETFPPVPPEWRLGRDPLSKGQAVPRLADTNTGTVINHAPAPPGGGIVDGLAADIRARYDRNIGWLQGLVLLLHPVGGVKFGKSGVLAN